ncbi:MAG: hypothetical protein AAFQ68_26205, partial [Bacteroidota bacterium]
RRKNQLFNLSFLDLITGALGAVIFLFIITPKGGTAAPDKHQVVMYMDTSEMKIFGNLHDSLQNKQIGDTLLTVLVDYQDYPKPQAPQIAQAEPEFEPEQRVTPVSRPRPEPESKTEKPTPKTEPKSPVQTSPTPIKEKTPKPEPEFSGDAPSVPAKVSFEVTWANQADNVDFFVCKGGDCVYGGRKNDRNIGQWDSGKSRNRLFGNDLRTSQEAVRQFDNITPGTYMLYARFKESSKGNKFVSIRGLIYTKNSANKQRGETYVKTIPLSESRVLIGKVTIRRDGTYTFTKTS